MEILIDVEKYETSQGFKFKWEPGFDITVKVEKSHVAIIANKEGLISLARHLLTLSQDEVPNGYDIHLDEYSSLEDGSTELIIVKAFPSLSVAQK
jgi:hypothetical protein